MAKEIERKFLVINDSYRAQSSSSHTIIQGYLSTNPEATVRVRLYDDRGFITVKSKNHGPERHEWEYEIPESDAIEMLGICTCVLRKVRYNCGRWEIDEFGGRLNGLVVAEIELSDMGEVITLPPFVGKEVTDDPGYYNSALAAALQPPSAASL